jgi:DNA end-binding protein Ku
MPRPIWKGHLNFGLVNIPVNLYSAEEPAADFSLHMLDSRDQSRIRYERINEKSGKEVPWNEIVRGYEYEKGEYLVLSEAELKKAAPEQTRAVEIDGFVDADQIDLLYFDKPYYLEPAKGGEKGYVLLREVLKDTKKIGIAKVVIRTRQHIAALVPKDNVLVLDLLRYPKEIRKADGLNIPTAQSKAAHVSAAELKMAKTLVEAMATDWKPQAYHDEYRDALMKYIHKRVEAGGKPIKVEEPADEAPAAGPYNFMELLKKSVEHGRGKGGKVGANGHRRKAPAPRKKAG